MLGLALSKPSDRHCAGMHDCRPYSTLASQQRQARDYNTQRVWPSICKEFFEFTKYPETPIYVGIRRRRIQTEMSKNPSSIPLLVHI